jgi:Tol biopolymer transport system component
MKKRIVLIVVVSLAVVLVLAPGIDSAVNSIRCQRHDGIAVRSTRQSFMIPLDNFEVICPDGSGTINHWIPHQLTDDATVAIAFSPDGTQVAFASYGDPRSSTGMNIYVMNTDGSEISQLLSMGYDTPHLAWSPNGKLLAFDCLLSSDFGIHVVSLDCIRIQSNCAAATTYLGEGTEPSWSPDGAKIAFQMNMAQKHGTADYDLWVMDADGSNRIDLTPDEFQAWSPAWSPDGQLIAFEYSRDPQGIYVMRPDGSGRTFLTDGSEPAWSSDSRNVVFVSDRDSNGRGIGWFDSIFPVQSLYMIEHDSGITTRLTHNDSEFIRYFTWLPK